MNILNKKSKYLNTLLGIIFLLLLVYSIGVTQTYLYKSSKSSDFYKEQEKDILAKFESEKLSVRVINQIDNYAIIEEHSLPVGGGW